MRIYVIDDNTEVELFIYGIDGNDHTEKFFVRHFSGKGVKVLSDEEKEKLNTTASYAINNICCAALEKQIGILQETIDLIADDYERNGCDVSETYTIDGRCYVI